MPALPASSAHMQILCQLISTSKGISLFCCFHLLWRKQLSQNPKRKDTKNSRQKCYLLNDEISDEAGTAGYILCPAPSSFLILEPASFCWAYGCPAKDISQRSLLRGGHVFLRGGSTERKQAVELLPLSRAAEVPRKGACCPPTQPASERQSKATGVLSKQFRLLS